MDDSEPDLYGGMGGYQSDDHDPYPHSRSYNVVMEHVDCPKFYTQEDMDKVIQASLTNARNQYEEGYDSGFEDGYKEGNENCQHR
jgi:hypothetical protein